MRTPEEVLDLFYRVNVRREKRGLAVNSEFLEVLRFAMVKLYLGI